MLSKKSLSNALVKAKNLRFVYPAFFAPNFEFSAKSVYITMKLNQNKDEA